MRDLRQHHVAVEHAGRVLLEPEAFECRERDDHRVVSELLALAQPGLDVPAQWSEDEVGAGGRELRAPADRTRTDERADRELFEGGADERVAGIGPFRNRHEHEPRRRLGREILGRMDRDIGAAVDDRLLDLAGEDASAADRVQLGGLVAVAGRRHEDELDVAPEARADAFRLPPRERTRAGRDTDHSVSTVGSAARSKSEARASA